MSVTQYIPDSSKIVHKTRVDFRQSIIANTVHLTQYDNSLPLVAVELYSAGEKYALPSNVTSVKIRFGKKDHTYVYTDALGCNEDRTVVYFEIIDQMTIFYGPHTPVVEVRVRVGEEAEEEIACSSYMQFDIHRNPIQRGDIESQVVPDVVEEIERQIYQLGLRSLNVINAEDIQNNTLSDEQYALLTNGRPTVIKGTIRLVFKDCVVFPGKDIGTSYIAKMVCVETTHDSIVETVCSVDTRTKVMSFVMSKFIEMYGVYKFNGAEVPDYPSNPSNSKVLIFDYETRNMRWSNVVPTNATLVNPAATELSYGSIYQVSLAADRTFTLKSAPTGTLQEYRAILTNSGNSAITITLPSGVTIKTNDSQIFILANTFELPAGASIELNIFDNKAVVYNWGA